MLKVPHWSVLALAGVLAVSAARGQTVNLQQDFATDPATAGWATHGDTNLFRWNATNQNLEVTWDSSQTNSYYYHPLGTTLGMDDDFSLSFDLQIHDATISGFGFELALGLLNLADATQPGFLRGTGNDSPNLVELDYFPDPDGILWWGPSITTMMVDSVGTNSSHWSAGGFAGVGLTADEVFHVEMVYSGSTHVLTTSITNVASGQIVGPVSDAYLPATFLGFYVDHVAIASYSDLNGWGTLLAEGTVDNLRVTATTQVAPRVEGGLAGEGIWEARFLSHTNWHYTLERSTNFQAWTNVSDTLQGNEREMVLQDTNAPSSKAFYRVRVE